MQGMSELHIIAYCHSSQGFFKLSLAYQGNVYFLTSNTVEFVCANSSVATDRLFARVFT